jgi:hypothetical protein
MKQVTLPIALFVLLMHGTASAQRSAPSNNLTRALATFAAVDKNGDGKLSAEEVASIPIDRKEFLAHDYDKDGSWSKDEFLVFYRRRLLLAGQTVGPELESETARIQALRNAKAAEDAKAKAAANEAALKSSQSTNPGGNVTVQAIAATGAAGAAANGSSNSMAAIEAGLESALEKLEQRAAAGHATREDFQEVRDHLMTRARAAVGSNAPDAPAAYGTEVYRKMQQSLDRLEKRASEGAYSKADYDEFRDMIIHRARQIAKKEAGQTAAPGSSEVAAIESGLNNALDALEQRASAGHATREDFQQVRDHLIARARAAAGSSAPGEPSIAPGSDTYQRMMQALDRLEKRAAEGAYSREEYQELRAMFIHRARQIQAAQNGEPAAPVDTRRAPAPVAGTDPAPQAPPPQRASGSTEPARDPNLPPAQPARPAGNEPREAPKPQRPPSTPPSGEPRSKSEITAEPQRPTSR